MLEHARAGRLRIVGKGKNRVDMVHVENVVDAQLLAEKALETSAAGRAYFITNDEPILLWHWINQLLSALGEQPVRKQIPLGAASTVGAICEGLWRVLPLRGEPPMTRFVAAELAKDHWFDISAAKRDLGYSPRVSMAEGTVALIAHLKKQAGHSLIERTPIPFPPTNKTA
jgi:nucleoside-diphosphate-sugar epimerase